MGTQTGLKLGLDRCRLGLAFEYDIAARDIGFDAPETGLAAYLLQFGHRQLAGASDIHRA
jgi:hypothetical protein